MVFPRNTVIKLYIGGSQSKGLSVLSAFIVLDFLIRFIKEDYMSQIIAFEIGCRHCACLEKIGKDSYECCSRVHMDDSPVIPIFEGKKTTDWNICEGIDYTRR